MTSRLASPNIRSKSPVRGRPKAKKKLRRSSDDIGQLRDDIYRVLKAEQPATLRSLFYRLVSQIGLPKLETEYHSIGRLLGAMRDLGEIPFAWVEDSTRNVLEVQTYNSLTHALEEVRDNYRRNLWADQSNFVLVISEKDAITNIVWPVVARFAVPLLVTRGYASKSYLHKIAGMITEQAKPTFIFYLGDFDPSGMDITRATEAALREYAPTAVITFERIAVTAAQIVEMNLPTRPTKATDSRARTFIGQSVEVDAIAPTTLRAIVETAIVSRIDVDQLDRTLAAEKRDQDTLAQWVDERNDEDVQDTNL